MLGHRNRTIFFLRVKLSTELQVKKKSLFIKATQICRGNKDITGSFKERTLHIRKKYWKLMQFLDGKERGLKKKRRYNVKLKKDQVD